TTMAEDKKGKGEKDDKKHEKHAKGEGPIVPKQEGEKKAKKGGREKKAPATIQAAQGKAAAKGEHPARLADAYKKNVIPQLMKDFGYKNPMQVPKVEKIVVNMGLGEAISNNKLIEQAQEQIILPEINYDKIEKIKGMNITIVTTAKNDEEGRALLRHMGMPFRTA